MTNQGSHINTKLYSLLATVSNNNKSPSNYLTKSLINSAQSVKHVRTVKRSRLKVPTRLSGFQKRQTEYPDSGFYDEDIENFTEVPDEELIRLGFPVPSETTSAKPEYFSGSHSQSGNYPETPDDGGFMQSPFIQFTSRKYFDTGF